MFYFDLDQMLYLLIASAIALAFAVWTWFWIVKLIAAGSRRDEDHVRSIRIRLGATIVVAIVVGAVGTCNYVGFQNQRKSDSLTSLGIRLLPDSK